MPRDEASVHAASSEFSVVENAAQKRDIGIHADNLCVTQTGQQPIDRLIAITAPTDDLGDHGIVEGGYVVPLTHTAVDAQALARLRETQSRERSRGRQEALAWVFRIHTHFNRMTVQAQLVLHKRQCLTARHTQLPLDQIEASDLLRHRVLNLQARVHFHEVGLIALHDELHGTHAFVVDRLGSTHRTQAKLAAQLLTDPGRRRLLDHLLIAPLHRTIALEQRHAVPVRIGQQLHLHMARLAEIPLDQHAAIAERRSCLTTRTRKRLGKLGLRIDDAHTAPAATGRRLDQNRITHALGRSRKRQVILRIEIARYHGHACGKHAQLGVDL